MIIQNSILAGEILSMLEGATCSVRIIDVKTILKTTNKRIHLAIARLLSEGLIDLINEDERSAIALTKTVDIPENNYLKTRMPECLMVVDKAYLGE